MGALTVAFRSVGEEHLQAFSWSGMWGSGQQAGDLSNDQSKKGPILWK